MGRWSSGWKRLQIIRVLESNGFVFNREGRKHSLFIHESDKTMPPISVPRHNNISPPTVENICRQSRIQKKIWKEAK